MQNVPLPKGLRAFNNELEAAIAKISWNNAGRMIERVKKTYEVLNDLGAPMRTEITRDYLKLALAELRLTYEWEQKKQSIKEEQRKIKEQMREEELAQREFERVEEWSRLFHFQYRFIR